MLFEFFFFQQKTAYEFRISDWSSDVCSSDLSLSILAKCWLCILEAGSSALVNWPSWFLSNWANDLMSWPPSEGGLANAIGVTVMIATSKSIEDLRMAISYLNFGGITP